MAVVPLLRFAHYAVRFERAVRTNEWRHVRACFADDAIYTMHGAESFAGEHRGSAAIVATLQHMLDTVDRRFDRRIPAITGWPTARDGVVRFSWRARYVLGKRSAVLTGRTECTFRGAKIVRLVDTMPPAEIRAVLALLT